MMSTEEILSPNEMLLQHFQRADEMQKNRYVYKKGTPFEMVVTLDKVPQTSQDYFELALKIEVEANEEKLADAEMQQFYQVLASEMPNQAKLQENLLIIVKKAETVFFTKTKNANKTYHEKLLQKSIVGNAKLEQEILQDMLSEVNAAIIQQGDLIRSAIVTYEIEKRKLEKANESQSLFERVINFESTPKSHFVSNLLIDAAMAGHVWASVVIKAQLQEIKIGKGVSIWLPRKLLPHELQLLKADLEVNHDGHYYRAESPEHAKKISENLFASQDCLY
jgi:hypothetical protein